MILFHQNDLGSECQFFTLLLTHSSLLPFDFKVFFLQVLLPACLSIIVVALKVLYLACMFLSDPEYLLSFHPILSEDGSHELKEVPQSQTIKLGLQLLPILS